MEASPSVPFVGDLDDDAIARRIPHHHRMRGMFFRRVTRDLDLASIEKLAHRLREPTRTYLPFQTYPTGDYNVLFGASARRVHPSCDGREAWRRYARDEIAGFAETMIGGVTLSLVSDPTGALMRYPDVFNMLANGPSAIATKIDDRAVDIELTNAYGPVEYFVGLFEGVVMSYKRHPRVELTLGERSNRYLVRWTV